MNVSSLLSQITQRYNGAGSGATTLENVEGTLLRNVGSANSSKEAIIKLSCITADEQREQKLRVQRLKEHRMKEKAAKEALKKAKQIEVPTKKRMDSHNGTASRSKSVSTANKSSLRPTKGSGSSTRVINSSHNTKFVESSNFNSRRLKFSDIMKVAETVREDKLKLGFRVRSKKDIEKKRREIGSSRIKSSTANRSVSVTSDNRNNTLKGLTSNFYASQLNDLEAGTKKLSTRASKSKNDNIRKIANSYPKPKNAYVSSTPAPFSRPMPKLAAKLEKSNKRRRHDEDDYDLSDDFIVDDEEEDVERPRKHLRKLNNDGPGYDRDEIWAIFNRGKKRDDYQYDDYDSDDMEANGTDVLMEESRSTVLGRLEDLKEEKEEKKRAKLKSQKMKNSLGT